MSLYKEYSYIENCYQEFELVKYKKYTLTEKIAADKIYNNWLKIRALKYEEKIKTKIKSEKELDEEYWATHMSSRPRKYTSAKKY